MQKLMYKIRLSIVLLATIAGAGICLAQGPPPDQPDVTIDEKAKAEVIHSLGEKLKEQYVFPDVADKLAKMLEDREAHGDYASVSSGKEFSELLTKQMREIAHDAHLHVVYVYKLPPMPPPPKPGQPQQPPPQMLVQLKKENYGFDEAKRLSGNIGYLKLNGFTDADRGGDTVAGAMAFLANTDALIIDLRQNHGGSPQMVDLLASYFFSGNTPVHLNDLSWRKPGTKEHDIQQWWTLPYVPGTRYLDKEVYILTSHATPSAAEEFTYDLKAAKRATVVGETTWGGANPGGMLPVGEHFGVFIPRGQAINPVTKTNWEGTGIEPDIKVPQSDALKTAHVTALQHLIDKTKDERELSALKQALAAAQTESGEQKEH